MAPCVAVGLAYGEVVVMQQPKPTPLPKDDDVRWLAIVIRRGLMVIVRAIEERYDLGEREKAA